MYIKQGSHTNISAYVQSVAHAALYFWVINKLSSDPFFYDFLSLFFTKPFFFVIVWLFKNWYWFYHHFLCTFFNLYWFIGKCEGLWRLFFVRNERGPKFQLDCTHTVRYNDRTLSQWLFVMMQSALKNQTIWNNYPIKLATKKYMNATSLCINVAQNALFAFEWGFQNCNFHHPKTKTRTGLFYSGSNKSLPFNWKKMRPLHVFQKWLK